MSSEGQSLDERLNQRITRADHMGIPERENDEDEKELNQLSDVYSVLRQDAKAIISDLKGGIGMWREAAYGSATVAGFIIILILTAIKYGPTPDTLEGLVYVIVASITAVAMAVISARGFRKYSQLRKKYAPLFARAEKM
jgi:hypothetical protein